ncbi:hypothetical protein C8F04DRAFT_1264169 [Mycena alexandri]|uniref:Uncharacterized protein n=1 Tax=Mycena alexandri TaxID=1745969 RepID=A0AAD6SLU9_9AGAR|nr:hypothetical protein C8F04DRAFT_1264169 [Mycena alexandri]
MEGLFPVCLLVIFHEGVVQIKGKRFAGKWYMWGSAAGDSFPLQCHSFLPFVTPIICCDPQPSGWTLRQQRHLTTLTEASPHSAHNSGNLSRLETPVPSLPRLLRYSLFCPLNSACNTKRGSDWSSLSSRCLRPGASPAGRTLPIARPAAATAVPLCGRAVCRLRVRCNVVRDIHSRPASATQQKHDAQPQRYLQHLQRWSPVAFVPSHRSPSPARPPQRALPQPFPIANADCIPAAATALCAIPMLHTLPYAHSSTFHIAARFRNTRCVLRLRSAHPTHRQCSVAARRSLAHAPGV